MIHNKRISKSKIGYLKQPIVRVFVYYSLGLEYNSQHFINKVWWWYISIILSCGNEEQGQKVKVILSYIVSPMSAWAISDSVSRKK